MVSQAITSFSAIDLGHFLFPPPCVQLEAQDVVVNQSVVLFGIDDWFTQEIRDEFGSEIVNADVTLNQGILVQGDFDFDINGLLYARNGPLQIRVWEPRYLSVVSMSESALFGEGLPLRKMLDSPSAEDEILLDRYLIAGSYDLTPQSVLSAQLEPLIAPGLLKSGDELAFRFGGLSQTYVYRKPENVPELDGAAAPLAAVMLLAAGAISREQRRMRA